MAKLYSKHSDVTLILQPYRIAEEGDPTWILTQVEINQGGMEHVSTVISITNYDLDDLKKQITQGISDGNGASRVASTDGDFIFELQEDPSTLALYLIVWLGEPYVLMKGFRFVTNNDNLAEFLRQLESDSAILESPGRLPV